jgi:hypothetical protein
MDPDNIKLNSISKLFEYEKLSRDIDICQNINDIKDICKSYVKLYMKQQETLTLMENTFSNLNN